ncbi:hypothetical protein APHAL10511_002591 [Amanita phalloides]|nr:hypothetical protein APHAL10511_002591 [Amanita phalloides]
MSPSKDIYLVIGGSGFVGRHIVQQLLDRGDTVSVLDIVQRYHDLPFYSVDITDQYQVAAALRKSGTTCIIHTASPPAGLKDEALYYRVNVDGTKAVIAAAAETGVRKLVFTSSAGVVFDGSDLINADERLPFPEVPMDAYNDSKAKAEAAVLAANGKDGLLTVALRPAGIFGPGALQLMAGLYQVYEYGQTHFQIGGNKNLFDWTYVGNVAHAHLLAADRLEIQPPAPPLSESKKNYTSLDDVPRLTSEEEDVINYPLPTIDLSTGHHRVPTCEARPLGPYVTPPANADRIAAAYANPNPGPSNRPVVRTRFDAFSDYSLRRSKLFDPSKSPLQVAGQAFFITNGEPCYFWDFARLVWRHLDNYFPGHRKDRGYYILPRMFGMAAASGAEWYGWLTGKQPAFTRFRVTFSCASRWYNIEKARRVLEYEPQTGLEDGVQRMIEWWYDEYQAGTHNIEDSTNVYMSSCALFPPLEPSYILSFQFSSWYPNFSDLSFKSKIIRPLSQSFRDYLDSDSIFVPEGSEDVPFQSELSDDEDLTEDANQAPSFAFPELDSEIRECIKEFGAVFPKLNFSSPKDASWVLPASSPLKCVTPADVYMLLKSSDFVTHDLDAGSVFEGVNVISEASPPYELELILRKWYAIDSSREFRCFVRKNRFLGISQRDTNYYQFLNEPATKEKIVTAVIGYWDSKVKTRWKTNEDYVFDILMTRDLTRGHILDFNPYAPRTDALLFTYDELQSLLEADTQTPDLRVIESHSHPFATRKTPVHQHNMVPFDALDMSSGKSISDFAELLEQNIWESMRDNGI